MDVPGCLRKLVTVIRFLGISGGILPCSVGFVNHPVESSPPLNKRERTGDRVLAEGSIDLPEAPWMLTDGELRVLYLSHGLNTWQIAELARVSHTTIIEHMKRHRIVRPPNRKKRPKYLSLLAALLA